MPEKSKISELIDELAMQTVMVELGDLLTLGSILEKLESIEKIGVEEGLKSVSHLSSTLKKLVEKIILEEISDPANGLTLLREGVRILQKKISLPASADLEIDEVTFWERIQSLGKLELSPPPSPEKAPGPSQETPSDPSQDVELCRDFISEALEHLNTIELHIISLEQAPEDKECINAIFRPFHTIKGVSGFLNLKEINKFAHAMESLLDDARNQKIRVHREMIDFILEAVDFLKEMILALKGRLDSGEISQSPFEMDDYLKKITLLQTGEAKEEGKSPEALPEDREPVGPPLGVILCSQGVISPGDLQAALKEQAEEKGGKKIGEILIGKNAAKPKQVLEALREQKKVVGTSTEATVKVDTLKLDNLIDLVGELVIAQSLVQQNSVFSSVHDQKLSRDFSQMKRITDDLQKISMSLRMIPIRQTFQKMIRLVRDLAQKSGKSVNLIMSGEETEIDRSMVDQLYDPLVHMIRNSIDHGIELPSKRQEDGKLETGRILLKAFQKGGYIIIEVEDDGQGLNRPKILKKAQEKGLVSPEASLSEFQIDNLIFEAGFSTADRVTDVSGRGVGMDVVKKAIEQLKGKVEIFSIDGKGCRFVIRLPLTLAIMDGIVVRIGEERYILPTVFIKEILRPNRGDLATVQHKGELIKVRNVLLPLVRLYSLLGVIPRKKDPWESLVVVVENGDRQKGLMVDDLIGKQEVVVKNLGEKLKAVKGVAGATIMGNGQVGLILDIHGIFDIDQNTKDALVTVGEGQKTIPIA
jgi:two-component system, chemotaxis family, sensor kinase CheA